MILLGLVLGTLIDCWRFARSLSRARIRSIALSVLGVSWMSVAFTVLFIEVRYVGREPFFKQPYLGGSPPGMGVCTEGIGTKGC